MSHTVFATGGVRILYETQQIKGERKKNFFDFVKNSLSFIRFSSFAKNERKIQNKKNKIAHHL